VTGLAVDSRERALEQIRAGERFLLVTHEHPDGDALGSLIAMQGVLTTLGKDSLMFMAASELPLPYEYRFFELERLVTELPEDIDGRVVIFLDCGNIDRTPVEGLKKDGSQILNLDHHHDNTMFGDINHVVAEASCTAEIVWDLMGELRVRPTRAIAEALYVGLVTDTGKFMYENTGPRARPSLRRRSADDGRPQPRRLPHVRRGGQPLRGRHRPPAVSRGHQGRRAGSRARRGSRGGPQEGLAALDGRRDRRLADRARGGRRRTPPRRRLHDDARRRAAGAVPARPDRRADLTPSGLRPQGTRLRRP
jgi:hypothetical protein